MEISTGIVICCFIFIKQQISVCAQKDYVGGELGYQCSTIRDCRPFGYVCRENTCQCDQWYIPDKQKRKCIGGVDQKCLYDEHCIEGAYCMNQSICKCKHSSSLPLEHGLICAGVADLKVHQSINLTFFVTGVVITVFRGTYT